MNLKKATQIVTKLLKSKQDPDLIVYTKEWDEFGYLKGWWVNVSWGDLMISYDITEHYIRRIGNINEAPNYIKGKHQVV